MFQQIMTIPRSRGKRGLICRILSLNMYLLCIETTLFIDFESLGSLSIINQTVTQRCIINYVFSITYDMIYNDLRLETFNSEISNTHVHCLSPYIYIFQCRCL